jgi:ketosteroid isomerase-like protein
MASPTPVEVFQVALAAMQAGDVPALLAQCTDDIVFEFPFAPAGRPARVTGKDALGEYMTPIFGRAAFERADLVTHQTVDHDVVVIEMTAFGHTHAGEPFTRPYIMVLTVRDGLIARYRDYWAPSGGPAPRAAA